MLDMGSAALFHLHFEFIRLGNEPEHVAAGGSLFLDAQDQEATGKPLGMAGLRRAVGFRSAVKRFAIDSFPFSGRLVDLSSVAQPPYMACRRLPDGARVRDHSSALASA